MKLKRRLYSKCNRDCFNCKYDDCILDCINEEERISSIERDIDILSEDKPGDSYKKRYYWKNRDKCKQWSKETYYRHKEKQNERSKEYYHTHKERARELNQRWQEEHRELIRSRQHEYYIRWRDKKKLEALNGSK